MEYDSRWRRNRAVEFRRLGADSFQARLTSDIAYFENVAACIWRLLDGKRTVADIAVVVGTEYVVDSEVALADTAEFIDSLARRSFVEHV